MPSLASVKICLLFVILLYNTSKYFNNRVDSCRNKITSTEEKGGFMCHRLKHVVCMRFFGKILSFHWMSQPLSWADQAISLSLPDRKFVWIPDIQKQTCLEHTQPQAHKNSCLRRTWKKTTRIAERKKKLSGLLLMRNTFWLYSETEACEKV